jgi:transposase
VELYPLNPKQLARFREAVYPSGRKSDPCDAELLATFLANHRDKLHRWEPDLVETRLLAELVELRRKLVDERKSQQLRLLSTLKQYFPLIVTLFKDALISDFVLQLLKRWPSLTELQRANPKTLRSFLHRHGGIDNEQQTTLIKKIRSAMPLTKDPALMETYPLYVQSLVQQILELNKSVAQFDHKLKAVVAKHPDEPLFRRCPGAGEVLVPRLIAAFGSDRDRYQSAEEVQSYTGIAPIIQASGKSRVVSKRIFCPRFLRQTFHEFADQARRWSSWSRAYYKLKRSQGMKHQAAVRALAFKWIRIMFHLWKTRTLYSEAFYIQKLKEKGSPIIAFLEPI